MDARQFCYCEGPWADIEPENRPETVLEREHTLGAIINATARCEYAAQPHKPEPTAFRLWYQSRRFRHRPVARRLLDNRLYCEYCGRGVTQRRNRNSTKADPITRDVHYGFRIFTLER